MKKLTIASLVCVLFFSACNKTSNSDQISSGSVDELQQTQLQTPQQINAFIQQVLNQKGEFN